MAVIKKIGYHYWITWPDGESEVKWSLLDAVKCVEDAGMEAIVK